MRVSMGRGALALALGCTTSGSGSDGDADGTGGGSTGTGDGQITGLTMTGISVSVSADGDGDGGGTTGPGDGTADDDATSGGPTSGTPATGSDTGTPETSDTTASVTATDDGASSGDDATGDTTGGFGDVDICDLSGPPFLACNQNVGMSMGHSETLGCDPSGTDTVFDVYAITGIANGACVWAQVDNIDAAAGATGADAGHFMLVFRNVPGASVDTVDDVACTDPVYDGGTCPRGGVSHNGGPTLFIGVGALGGGGCLDPAPYTLYVTVNGTDLDLSDGPIIQDSPEMCSG